MPPCDYIVARHLQVAYADTLPSDLVIHRVVAIRVRAHGYCAHRADTGENGTETSHPVCPVRRLPLLAAAPGHWPPFTTDKATECSADQLCPASTALKHLNINGESPHQVTWLPWNSLRYPQGAV